MKLDPRTLALKPDEIGLEGLQVDAKQFEQERLAAQLSDSAYVAEDRKQFAEHFNLFHFINTRVATKEARCTWVRVEVPGYDHEAIAAFCRMRNAFSPGLFFGCRRTEDGEGTEILYSHRWILGHPGGRPPSPDSLRAKLGAIPVGETVLITGYRRNSVQSTISQYRDELPDLRVVGYAPLEGVQVRHMTGDEPRDARVGSKYGLGTMQAGERKVIERAAEIRTRSVRAIASALNSERLGRHWAVESLSAQIIVHCLPGDSPGKVGRRKRVDP